MKHIFKKLNSPELETTKVILSSIITQPRIHFEKELEGKIHFAFQKESQTQKKTSNFHKFTWKRLVWLALPLMLLVVIIEPNFVFAKFTQVIEASKKMFLKKEFGGEPVKFTEEKPKVHLQMVYPILPKKNGFKGVTQYFGNKHHGIDFSTEKEDDPIFAAADGTVTFSGCGAEDKWNGGYGCTIILDHENGIETLYAHNTSNLVSIGDIVRQGQTIATMGTTGYGSVIPFVHFEVRVNNVAVNPIFYLPEIDDSQENST